MKKRKFIYMLVLVFSLQLNLSSSVFAFSDIQKNGTKEEILELKKRGIVKGVGNDKFLPNKELTYAEAVHLLVKGLDLSIDHIRFIKEPSTVDYFTNISNDKWYSDSFIVGQLNGLSIPKEIKATTVITKEELAHLLFEGLSTKGEFAFIELWMVIDDEVEINSNYMSSIQKLLIGNIVSLEDNHFYPKKQMDRALAAKWVYQTIQFLENK